MARVNKTKKELTKQMHPSKKNKKKTSKAKNKVVKKQVTPKKIVKVEQIKKTETIEKVVKTKEVTNEKKIMEHHPLRQLAFMLVVGIIIGITPFFFYKPTNKNSTDEDTDCTYTDWTLADGDYCMFNASGEYFESDTIKYEFDEVNNKCSHYIRVKTCK